MRLIYTRNASLLALLLSAATQVTRSSSPPPANGMVLRIRLGDGSMEKIRIPPGMEGETTLKTVLSTLSVEDESAIQVNGKAVDSSDATIADLGLNHGSIVSITTPPVTSQEPVTESRFAKLKHESNIWNPYPDLAKDFEHALLQTKVKRSSQKGMSFNALSKLRSSLHNVEPQSEGPLTRIYMCKHSAERFQANGVAKSGGTLTARYGLLLGTVQRERVDMGRPRKARTSLSSQTSDSDYCTVAKVQAVWEPSGQKMPKHYDCSSAETMLDSETGKRVLEVAKQLGLEPVGWIYSYLENRQENEDALPIYGSDLRTGAMLQISNMKRHTERLDGAKFVTLAMDAKIGATEAFQLSDVSVQMVAEGMLAGDKLQQRHVKARHELIVDGKETTTLDSVLCLVNTAMLSHVGYFSGPSPASGVKKNGGLTTKKKKNILKSINDDKALLGELCDFNVLLALDQSLSNDDSKKLCSIVRKWSRGQKEGTVVSPALKLNLRSIVET